MEKGNLSMFYTQHGDTAIGITEDNCVETGLSLVHSAIAKHGDAVKMRFRANKSAETDIIVRAARGGLWERVSDCTPEEANAAILAISTGSRPALKLCGLPVYEDFSLATGVGAMALDVMEPEQQVA